MMHRIKYSKSLVESGGMIKNGLSVLLLLKPQKGLVPSAEWVSDVGGVSSGFSSASASASAAASIGESSSLMKRDMFRARYIPNMFRGRQTGGCVSSFVPPQCSKSRMLPYFARSIVSSSVSQSSGQTQRQEPQKQRKECQIISSELQRERCDEISSTEVSLKFPELMVHGNVADSKTRRLLRLDPDTGYFEEQGVSAAASNHHGHYELQVPHAHVCRGSAYGWLFLTNDNLDMKLLNPFSGAEIQLPPVTTLVPSIKGEHWFVQSKWSVSKAVFSANPSIEPRPVIFIVYNEKFGENRLAFCKPGDKGWTRLGFSDYRLFLDVIYHQGQFYVLSWQGYVTAFDIGRCINDDDHSVKTTLIATPSVGSLHGKIFSFEPLQPKMRDSYLVVLDGELVKFELRSVSFHNSCIDETKEFLEWEMNRGDTSDEYFTDEDLTVEDFFGFLNKKAKNIKMDPVCKIQTEASNHEDFTDEENDDVDIYEVNREDFTYEESDDVDRNDGKKKCSAVDPRLHCVDPRASSCTYSIKIRRLDARNKQWMKVESLGDKAVFLGFNTSFAISASDYPAGVCIPDSVYFIDAGGGMYDNMVENTFYDMGIYNVKDQRLKPLYPQNASKFIKPAPIWIVNSADS